MNMGFKPAEMEEPAGARRNVHNGRQRRKVRKVNLRSKEKSPAG
jgi:hypothetical protein